MKHLELFDLLVHKGYDEGPHYGAGWSTYTICVDMFGIIPKCLSYVRTRISAVSCGNGMHVDCDDNGNEDNAGCEEVLDELLDKLIKAGFIQAAQELALMLDGLDRLK